MLATSNFLVPNTTFIVEFVAFLLVLGFLARYVLPPLNKAMNERQSTIRQALVDAEEAKQRAAEAEVEFKRIVGEARNQARAVVEEANKMAEQVRQERRQQAEQEYERIVSNAYADIDAQLRRASEDLRRQAADLAIVISERVIGEGIDREAQRALIDRTIEEVSRTAMATESA